MSAPQRTNPHHALLRDHNAGLGEELRRTWFSRGIPPIGCGQEARNCGRSQARTSEEALTAMNAKFAKRDLVKDRSRSQCGRNKIGRVKESSPPCPPREFEWKREASARAIRRKLREAEKRNAPQEILELRSCSWMKHAQLKVATITVRLPSLAELNCRVAKSCCSSHVSSVQ